MIDEPGFDLNAASLRADDADLPAFVEVLAVKLEGALPTLCRVRRRRRGLLSSATRVDRIEVELGSRRFLLCWQRHRLVTEIDSAVHDMRRTRSEVPLGEWLTALQAELRARALSSAEARTALERLLET